jgi:hypothetical protein
LVYSVRHLTLVCPAEHDAAKSRFCALSLLALVQDLPLKR